MKTNFKSLALAAIAVLGMSACSNELDEQLIKADGQELSFDLAINGMTRTTTNAGDHTTAWSENDEVGLFAYETGTTNLVITNAKLTLKGGKWTTEQPIYNGKAYDFYAYYPYAAEATNPNAINVKVNADQTAAGGYDASDVLASKVASVAADATDVALSFNHVFSLVEVKVSGELVTATPASVTLDNVLTEATLDLNKGVATATGTATSVKAEAIGNNNTNIYSFRAIVPAQTVAKNTQLLTVNGVANKDYAMKYDQDVIYSAGKYRQLSMNIGKAKVELTIPAPTINPWTPDTEIQGQGSEVVKPAVPVTTFDVPFTAPITFGKLGMWEETVVETHALSETDAWFHREKDAAQAATVPTVNANTLELKNPANKRGLWNTSSVVFHKAGLFEQTTYKVTIVVSSTMADNADPKLEGIVGIAFSGSQDNKYFKMINDKGADWNRSCTTFNGINNTAKLTKSFYIDCGFAINDAKSSKVTAYAATTKDDVAKGLNVYLYNYTNDVIENTIIVESVKVEKAALPTVK